MAERFRCREKHSTQLFLLPLEKVFDDIEGDRKSASYI